MSKTETQQLTAPEGQQRPWANAAERIVTATKEMPPAPPVGLKIYSMLTDNNANNSEVVDVIRRDPDLTAELLRMSNTAGAGGSCEIMTLDEAVLRLGYKAIIQKVMAIAFGQVANASSDPVKLEQTRVVWKHSLCSALSCERLAPLSRRYDINADAGYTAGLLHNIGAIILILTSHEGVAEIDNIMKNEGVAQCDAEVVALGADHAEIGGLLLERWSFPEPIVNGARYHNDPESDSIGLAKITHVGSACADCAVLGNFDEVTFTANLNPYSLEFLGLEIDDVKKVFAGVMEESSQIEQMLLVK